MSVEEARKILGPKYDSMTDSQIRELVDLLQLLAKEYISQYFHSTKVVTLEK